jgi:phospholipid/cholesterol/gamma-HCH transport system substrate-binding protein
MEDRAKYVLIGLFTFAVIVGAFGFVYWLHNEAGSRESASYRVIFDGSVTGLRVGAPVLFNGIRVGDVTNLRLTDNPSQVAATLAVKPETPVRKDTRVTLEYAGLTGIASVSMKGVLSSAPPLPKTGRAPPTLHAESNAGQDMSTAVRETLAKANAVIDANQDAIRDAIANLETFSKALSRNSDKLDELVDGSNKLVSKATDAITTYKKLGDNLNTRTASITKGINKLTDTATKQIDIVGGDAHRAIIHIDKAVTDLAKHPQRILFGGGGGG